MTADEVEKGEPGLPLTDDLLAYVRGVTAARGPRGFGRTAAVPLILPAWFRDRIAAEHTGDPEEWADEYARGYGFDGVEWAGAYREERPSAPVPSSQRPRGKRRSASLIRARGVPPWHARRILGRE